MIHVIRTHTTVQERRDMLETLQTYIKLAVDVRRRVVAGGGAMHADAEAALLEDGSRQADVWGADWVPKGNTVRFESLINIRPKQDNRSMAIVDPALRSTIESIILERIGGT